MALINPENRTQIVVIILAVIVGIIAAVLVSGYVTSKVNEETRALAVQYEKSQKQREQLYKQDMEAMNKKLVQVEANAKKAAEDAARMAKEKATQAAQPQAKKKPSLALRTPSGKRAVTVMMESVGAVGGLLNPGDFVDVIAHLNVPSGKKGATKESVTAMVFQNLQVLAIETNLDEPGAYDAQQKLPNLRVTFAVDPQEAGLLAFSEKNGKLELALRSPSEKGHEMLPAATWATLSEYVLENNGADIPVFQSREDMPVTAVQVKEDEPTIEIFRGGREL